MTYDQLIAALFPNGAPETFQGLALILPGAAVQSMAQAQQIVASDRHRIEPRPTTDGRYFLAATMLRDLAPGGLFEAAMPHFDPSTLAGVEVVPWADGVALLPEPEDPLM